MGSYALIKDGIVVNIINWDGEGDMDFGAGVTTIEYDASTNVGIGYSYSKGKFSQPTPTPEEMISIESQKVASNVASKDSLLNSATQKITIWQVKLLMGRKLTDKETASLSEWMDYIDILNNIDAETSDKIEWPPIPS